MGWAEQFVAQYGYIAIFVLLTLGIVGPLIPDETILVVSGILIRQGKLEPLIVLLAAYAGSVCGITLSYLLGRSGAGWVSRHTRHLERAQDWFARFGCWTLFFGYFIAGVRHFTALAAGTARMKPRTFAVYAYSGGFVWVVTFLSIGYFVGDQWSRMAHKFDRNVLIAAGVGLVIGFIIYLLRRRYLRR